MASPAGDFAVLDGSLLLGSVRECGDTEKMRRSHATNRRDPNLVGPAQPGGSPRRRLGDLRWLGAGLGLLSCLGSGCKSGPATKSSASWPSDAVFQAYPVIHCSAYAVSGEVPKPFLAEISERKQDPQPARDSYLAVRDTTLTTLNLFLATGRWAGSYAKITPTRELPRVGTPPECRMFELALAEEISVRLPPSVSGAPYIAPLAMVDYDYERSKGQTPPRITVRVAALLAEGSGRVLRTLRVVATTDYARTSPFFQERPAEEIAQDLTEQIARELSAAIAK